MSLKDRLRREDQRLLGLIGGVAIALCLDAALRLWPISDDGDQAASQAAAPTLAAPRPEPSALDTLLAQLQPPAPEDNAAAREAARLEAEKNATPALKEEEQAGLLAELFIDRHRFRLRACFASSDGLPFAAVERIDADSGARSLDRLEEADPLGPYTVNSIDRRSLTLSAPDGRTIELRLFELDPQPRAG